MQGQDLAARMGLAAPTVSQRLTGKRDWRLDDLPVLAEIFDVPMETFLREPAEVFELRVNGQGS
jgi:transcriptional regulator with XRE-family HTH domain